MRKMVSMGSLSVLMMTSVAGAAPDPVDPPSVASTPGPARPLTLTTTTTATAASTPADADRPAADNPAPETANRDALVDRRFLHGFRLGYDYVMNYDKPASAFGGQSLKEKTDMKTPSHFLIGYEGMLRMVGHSWLNVILVGNAMIAGLEQSRFFPTLNGLIGFEIDNSFQLGVGPSLSPLSGYEAHAILAAGWTPRVGTFYVPLHAFFIPDVDGVHRMGVTTGVTW